MKILFAEIFSQIRAWMRLVKVIFTTKTNAGEEATKVWKIHKHNIVYSKICFINK